MSECTTHTCEGKIRTRRILRSAEALEKPRRRKAWEGRDKEGRELNKHNALEGIELRMTEDEGSRKEFDSEYDRVRKK